MTACRNRFALRQCCFRPLKRYGWPEVEASGPPASATMATATSGDLWDGVFDLQAPLDKDGYYTIVVSLPEDRPKNATNEKGVAWINWGPGEGLGDPRDRKDWGMLLMRFMVCHKDWENSPQKAAFKPGTEAAVMGPYYPRGYYTTKEKFEAEGVKK